MSQGIFNNIDPTVTTGLMLAGLLDDFKDAIVSGFSGTSRPTNLQTGGMWIDVSQQEAPNYYWTMKLYNGTTDIEIFRISVLTGTSGFTLADGTFTIRKISADAAGAVLNLVKNRIATSGQVLSGDTVAEFRLIGRTSTATDPIIGYIRATASEDQTATARGVTFSFVSTPVGTAALTEHMRFLQRTLEFTQGHKINSLIFGNDSVATSSSLLLTGEKIVSELTGSTDSNVHGVEVDDDTRVKYIHNRSSAEVVIKHESLTAGATQRFKLPNARDITLTPNSTAGFFYCTTDSRWKYFSGALSGVRSFIYNFVSGYSEWVATLTGNVRVVTFQEPSSETAGAFADSASARAGMQSFLAWGKNDHGQLGAGDSANKSFPTLVVGNLEFKDGMISGPSSFGLTEQGDAYAWGLNGNGELGLGDVVPRSSPVAVLGGLKFSRIDMNDSSYGIQFNGKAYAWGLNDHGQLGLGDVVPRSSPVAVLLGLKFSVIFRGPEGEGSAFGVVRDSGALYGWGQNAQGRLGLGDLVSRSSPVAVLGGLKFRKVAVGVDSNIGLSESGVAYGWGSNTDGELGNGNVVSRSSPVAVLGGLLFRDVMVLAGTDNSFYGITEDGTLYAWGGNANGQLGLGDVVPRSSPVAVLGGLKFETLARLGVTHSVVAIQKGTGAAYAWGLNTVGQLGLGDTTPRSSPVAVTGGLKFSSILMGEAFAVGQADDGRQYAWGENGDGQLGDGSTTDRSAPTLVQGATEPFFEIPTVKLIPVVLGTTYKIKLGGGLSFFGSTYIGKNIRRATVAFED